MIPALMPGLLKTVAFRNFPLAFGAHRRDAAMTSSCGRAVAQSTLPSALWLATVVVVTLVVVAALIATPTTSARAGLSRRYFKRTRRDQRRCLNPLTAILPSSRLERREQGRSRDAGEGKAG